MSAEVNPPPSNAEAKRRELVAQAADLFDRTGYNAVNVAQLAEAAGIRKPTLYHYFKSKDEILFWIHEEFIDLLLAKHAARGPMSPADGLRAIMRDVLELMRTHRGHVRVFFEHHRELAPADKAQISRKRDEYTGIVEDLFARGAKEKQFRKLDPRLTTLAFFGMCNWAYQWYDPDGTLTTDKIGDFFWDLLQNGVRPR